MEVLSPIVESDSLAAYERRGVVFGLNQRLSSYTLVLSDRGKTVEVNSVSPTNITVPNDASVAFPVGTYINVLQYGSGQVTIVPDSSVTLRTAGGLKTRFQYSMMSLFKRAANEWIVCGDGTS